MNYVQHWNKVAEEFDSLYDPGQRWKYALNQVLRRGLYQRTEMACEVIQRLGSPSVLDVGCGSGRNIVSFLEAGACQVTGIDSASGMLQLARKLTDRAGVSNQVRIVCDDFLSTGKLKPHDVVVALGVFDYLREEAPEFLQKMKRLSRSAVVFSAPGPSPLRAPLRALRYRFVKGIDVRFFSYRELDGLCRSAGFARYDIRRARSSGHVVTCWCQ